MRKTLKEIFEEYMSDQNAISFRYWYKDKLTEAPIEYAVDNDTDEHKDNCLAYHNISGIKEHAKQLKIFSDSNSNDLEIYLNNYNNTISIGSLKTIKNTIGFCIIGELFYKLERNPYGLPRPAYKIVNVEVVKAYRQKGIATMLYKSAVMNGYTIISDNHQYKGAVRTWKTLMVDPELKVELFNESTKTLYPIPENFNHDNIWSLAPNNSKEDIVLVLSKR